MKCIYLGPTGCRWRIKPIVCEMFLCDRAEKTVFEGHPHCKEEWTALNRRKKDFTWPDRPVLFDRLEKVFLDLGYHSTLMHLNFSPGLRMVKKKAGIV